MFLDAPVVTHTVDLTLENIVLYDSLFSFDLGLRYKLKIQDLQTTAGKVSQSSDGDVSNLCSDDFELRRKSYSLYPDGIFLAERVDICSPDEDEEDK